MYVQDNYDAFVIRESEHDRLNRLHKRFELEDQTNSEVFSMEDNDER